MTPRQPTMAFLRARVDAGRSVFVCAAIFWAISVISSAAEPLREGFETWEPTWQAEVLGNQPARVYRERTESAGRSGRGELIRLESTEAEVEARLTQSLPAARVLDELTATVWIRSEQPGWTLVLSVVAPGAIDPRTGQPRRFVVRGDVYREPGRWSALHCRTTNTTINQRLALLRAQFPEIQDPGQLYVEGVSLEARIPQGITAVHVDDLEFGPIVPADVPNTDAIAGRAAAPLNVPKVEFRLDRLLVDGRPFFPRMVRYHGEPPELLAELGFNVVWIPDLSDTRLIRRLWEHGLWVTATPPRPRDASGALLKSGTAGLIPFTAEADPVLFWMLGTRLPGDDQSGIVGWIEQLEFADRRRARPIAADVAFDERRYSRDVDM
ncbi:MAG: hypothetical protein B7Z55_14335, partial [Planctomycetales bacterium 12-60-4]